MTKIVPNLNEVLSFLVNTKQVHNFTINLKTSKKVKNEFGTVTEPFLSLTELLSCRTFFQNSAEPMFSFSKMLKFRGLTPQEFTPCDISHICPSNFRALAIIVDFFPLVLSYHASPGET